MQRRHFLQLALAGSAAGLLTLSGCRGRPSTHFPLILSGSDKGDQHTLSAWAQDEGERFRLTVDQRVHAPLVRPGSHEAVFVARRPGTLIYVVDILEGVISQQVTALPDRHFYGHAVFSADGRWLFVPENAFDEQGRGKLAVYDAEANYQRAQEFDLGGIGPHQLVLMPDGYTLAIALGGIQTHPDYSRDKLNLDSMRSELVFLDSRSGQITGRFSAPHQHLSLRHLDVDEKGQVMVGAQFQANADPDQSYQGPLVFLQQGDEPLKALQADDKNWLDQNHYIASVIMNPKGSLAITTSPRGGVVNLWQVERGELLRQFSVRDVAGAGYLPEQGCFVVSNGLGQLYTVADKLELLTRVPATRWDNHLSVVA